jgi:hypothetical protein
MENLQATLNRIQKELKAPKGQFNSFGNYKYRSCEDILESVKPLLGDKTLIINDEMVILGDRYYVKATVTISDGEKAISSSAYARESLDKKGMDSSQITGATSSYARKYALNGLFCIDDTKDADSHELVAEKKQEPKEEFDFMQDVPFQGNEFSKPAETGLGNCPKCGSEMVHNPKTGKNFCKDKCWLNQ